VQSVARATAIALGLEEVIIVVLLTWQAMRGQPLTSPDTTTLGALLALPALAGAATLAVVLHARRVLARRG
jgi:hypothetical protein